MSIVFICLLILFLSLGAPNQPGTFVIGLVIILTYLHAEALLPAAICAEISLGGITNIINVTGDMVMAAEGEKELIRKQM